MTSTTPPPAESDQTTTAAEQPTATSDPEPPTGTEPAAATPIPSQPTPDLPEPGEPPTPPTPVAKPARRSGVRWLLWGVLGLLVGVVLAVGGVVAYLVVDTLRSDPSNAEVGDCLDQSADVSDLRKVDCGSTDAAWSVLLVVPDVAERDFNDDQTREELCAQAEGWEFAFWVGDQQADGSGTGRLLCLSPVD